MTTIDDALLEELRSFPTPAVANGIEAFDIRPRDTGYMDASVRCMFPELGHAIGYAATATIRAKTPGDDSSRKLWKHVAETPSPRFVVVQDLDEPAGIGSLWGEVNSNIHQAFGAVGVMTNGCVRDLDEMRALGFHAFAGSVGVSHAYVHVEEVALTVQIGGLVVDPGDLLLGDQHGVIAIPTEIAAELPAAIRKIEEGERAVIATFRAPDFSPDAFTKDVTH